MKSSHFLHLVVIALLVFPICLLADNKPTDGMLLEVGFAPFSFGVNGDQLQNGEDVTINNNSILVNQITIRKLLGNGAAFRAGLNLDYCSDSQKNGSADWSQSSFLLGLQGGFEMHRAGTDKLSPYLGAIAGLNYYSSGQKSTDTNYESEVSGAWLTYSDDDYAYYNRAFTQVLLKGIVGCDYYFAQDIYLGLEINYGLDYKMYPEIKITTTDDGNTTTDKIAEDASSFKFGKSVNSMLRLGFRL